MKQFLEFIPLLLFFSVWAMEERVISLYGFDIAVGGIFNAAAALLAASILVYGGLFATQRKLDKFQWITFGGVVLACTLTIVFQSVTFLKWKAPIVNWIFATIFIGSHYFSDKPAIQHMMGHAINMPEMIWVRLNRVWIFYFIVLGAINLIVAYSLTEAAWLQFKVFGNLAITLTFVMGQMPILMKHIEIPEEDAENNDKSETKDPA